MADVMERAREKAEGLAAKEPREGRWTKAIERQTGKVPSVFFLNLGLASMAMSAGLAFSERTRKVANFIGLWVPTLLIIGIYNKLVKLEGHDRYERG